jgi:hypothetical protein
MRQNICTKKTYTKDGVEKVAWLNVGTMVEFNGKRFIELNIFPNQTFYVFDEKKKDEPVKPKIEARNDTQDQSEEIPF